MRDDELLHRFLLGELAEDEAESLEQRLLQEDELFDLCEAIEGDLLVASVRGDLTPEENERVLARLASSSRGRARLALARDLVEAARPAPVLLRFRRAVKTVPRWAGPFAAVAASLLLVVGVYRSIPPVPPIDEVAIDRPVQEPKKPVAPPVIQPPPAPPEEKVAEPTPPPEPALALAPAPRPTVVIQLLATAFRDADPAGKLESYEVPKEAGAVEIQLDLTGTNREDYESFSARVTSSDRREVWNRQGLQPQPLKKATGEEWGTGLALKIPADQLPAGKYAVMVEGVKAEGEPNTIGAPEFEIVTAAD